MNIRQTDEINPVLGNQQQYIEEEEEEVLRIVLPKSRLPSSSLFYDSTIPTTSTQVNPAVFTGPLSCSVDPVDYSVLGNANGCYSCSSGNGTTYFYFTKVRKFINLFVFQFHHFIDPIGTL